MWARATVSKIEEIDGNPKYYVKFGARQSCSFCYDKKTPLGWHNVLNWTIDYGNMDPQVVHKILCAMIESWKKWEPKRKDTKAGWNIEFELFDW